uniref:Uncharacterized protein n=1 Tax=Bionectria ochroleuca TaxID=29856 RepID=A0A8H7N3F4_BIOOC
MEDEHDQQGDTSSSTLSSAPSLVESDVLPTDSQSTQSPEEKEREEESKPNTASSSGRTRNATSRPAAKPASTVTIKRTAKARKWDAENIVIDPKSPSQRPI